MFQDGSVKTILTRSQKPLKPVDAGQNYGATCEAAVISLWHPPTPSCLSNWSNARDKSRTIRPQGRIDFCRFRPNDFKSFDPLFKVLFIFPSQYLFAIGFPHIFSLRRSLSPTWCTSIKVHDSSAAHPIALDTTDGALTLFGGPLATTSASRALGLTAYRLQFDGR